MFIRELEAGEQEGEKHGAVGGGVEEFAQLRDSDVRDFGARSWVGT